QFAGYWYEVGAAPQAGNSEGSKPNGINHGGVIWRPGLFVKAFLKATAAKPQEGISVPRTAVLFHQGRALVYVRLTPGRYQRREVQVLGEDAGRWILSAGVAAGELVVYRQAQVLLSEE